MEQLTKTNRQNEILRLVSEKEIKTQEEVAEELRELGFKVTQATVSRDIRELPLIKVASVSGGYRYAVRKNAESAVNERLACILTDALVQVEAASNLIVVHTLSGSANVAAEALDTLAWPEILGTIAGDNTIFIAARNESDAMMIAERIRKLTGNQQE